MANLVTQYGEEYFQRTSTGDLSVVASWTVGVYDDSTDTITDTDDIAAVTTEPGGASYSRQSITASNITFSLTSGDIQCDIPDVVFDCTDSTSGSVDSWFVAITFQASTVSADGSPTQHLVATGALEQSRTLNQVDNLTVQNIGWSVD